ncbi:chromogranin-A [Stigmatopora argus]
MLALLTLTLLVKSVLPIPVTPGALEDDDVKVMKCVVEALADVLSRPRPLPVSEQCLQTLRTDDRLLSLLRHYDFLKELHDVATHGEENVWPPEGGAASPHGATPSLENTDDVPPDGSMLSALGGPGGEHSILSHEPRRSDGREHDGVLWMAAEKREENKKEGMQPIASKEEEEEEEEEDQRSADDEEDEEEEGYGMKKRSKSKEVEEEAPHHSKEDSGDKEVKKKMKKKRNRSPEEKELQLIARRTPDEEDGSAARKAEDSEVENLATIESELENVAHKLRQLREG